MMEWLKIWANQVMMAVMIAVIFELILPNGNSKRYIKMMLNFYLLFIILNPLISKFTHQEIKDLQEFDYHQYVPDTVETSSNIDFDEVTENTYQKALKQDIIQKLAAKGYNASDISIDINNNKNDDEYGSIQEMSVNITKEKKEEDKIDSSIKINAIAINVIGDNHLQTENQIVETNPHVCSTSDIQKAKKILQEEYQVTADKIHINER